MAKKKVRRVVGKKPASRRKSVSRKSVAKRKPVKRVARKNPKSDSRARRKTSKRVVSKPKITTTRTRKVSLKKTLTRESDRRRVEAITRTTSTKQIRSRIMKQDFTLKTTKVNTTRKTKLSPKTSQATRERFKQKMFESLAGRLKARTKKTKKKRQLVSLRLRYRTKRDGPEKFVSLPLAEITSEAQLKILLDELVDGFASKTGEYTSKGMGEVLIDGTEMQVYE